MDRWCIALYLHCKCITNNHVGSNGTISTNLPASIKPYILRVTVYNGDTCVVTLKGKFRVYGDQEDYYCGVHFTNYGTQILNSNITFVSMGATRNFSVILDGDIIIRYRKCNIIIIIIILLVLKVT